MKWKVEYPTGKVEYHVPSETQLVMKRCTLKNYKSVAKTIFDGANKTVCAWILCDEITIKKENFVQFDNVEQTNKIRYNPRVTPHWVFDGHSVDGTKMEAIGSVDRGLYKIN